MSQIDYRANLSAAIFPMTVAKSGKSVIVPGQDQNFDRRIDAPGDTQRGSVGIPQVIYCENVVPTPDGFQSVGYMPKTAITIPASQTIGAIVPIRIATAEITETITTGGTILYNSTGTDLTAWEKAADNVPPNAVSGVEQDASGGNPSNNFELFSVITGSVSTAYIPSYPWIRKSFSAGNPTNAGFEIDINFDVTGASAASATSRKVVIGVFNNSANSGLHIVLDYSANTIAFGTATDILGTGFSATDSDTPSSSLALATWYRVEVTLTKVSGDPADQNRSVTVLLKNSGGTTIATLTGFYATALVEYCTLAFTSGMLPNDPLSGDVTLSLRADNIDVTGDGEATVTTTTEYTGIVTAYMAFFTNNTANWSYDLTSWDNYNVTEPGGFVSPTSINNISVAIVRGITYICVRESGATKIYSATVNTGTNTITLVDESATIENSLPSPYDIDSILGIVSSYNYLILYTPNEILWSSTTTPTDFAASLVSGAGNEIPGNLKGDITFCKEHVAGFFIYSAKNVIFAAYTGNARYPWKFREVGASGGFNYPIQVSGDTNSAVQYGLNNTKFVQILNTDSAEIVAPEVTNFLEKTTRWDIFNSTTYAFSLSDGTQALIDTDNPTVWFMLDRYLIVPYGLVDVSGVAKYSYCLVYDLLLRRYGKLKVTPDFCLSDEEAIYFINKTSGAISMLYYDIHDQVTGEGAYSHSGVIVLGKFQLARGNWLSVEGISVETLQNTDIVSLANRNFAIRILPSLNGKTFEAAVTPYRNTPVEDKDCDEYLASTHCQNFCIAMKGAFDLNGVSLSLQPEGDE